jgi:hypothetical protein
MLLAIGEVYLVSYFELGQYLITVNLDSLCYEPAKVLL